MARKISSAFSNSQGINGKTPNSAVHDDNNSQRSNEEAGSIQYNSFRMVSVSGKDESFPKRRLSITQV